MQGGGRWHWAVLCYAGIVIVECLNFDIDAISIFTIFGEGALIARNYCLMKIFIVWKLIADFNMEKALEGAFSKDYVLFIYFIYDFYNHKDKLIECSLSSLEYALFMYLQGGPKKTGISKSMHIALSAI